MQLFSLVGRDLSKVTVFFRGIPPPIKKINLGKIEFTILMVKEAKLEH
jgi:hypothetical protein